VQFLYLDFLLPSPPGNFSADALAFWPICYTAPKKWIRGNP